MARRVFKVFHCVMEEHVAVVVGTNVYLMGGFDGSERLNDLWKSSDCGNSLRTHCIVN